MSFSPDMGGDARKRKFRPATLLLAVAAAAALWVLFVSSSINLHEMMVGIASVIATVAFTFFVARSAGMRFELRLRDLVEGWRIPWNILSGVWEITLVLIKDLLRMGAAKHLFRVCGFDSSKHDPVRVARTVLAVAYTSCAPNFIVIGIDQTQSRMLFHQIARSGVPEMTRRLGARG